MGVSRTVFNKSTTIIKWDIRFRGRFSNHLYYFPVAAAMRCNVNALLTYTFISMLKVNLFFPPLLNILKKNCYFDILNEDAFCKFFFSSKHCKDFFFFWAKDTLRSTTLKVVP